jgi:hypothetical protein
VSSGYRWCVDDSAYDALADLRPTQRRRVIVVIRELARHPFRAPAFTTTDSEGLEISILYAADCMISYRIDHAARMLHILEITYVP